MAEGATKLQPETERTRGGRMAPRDTDPGLEREIIGAALSSTEGADLIAKTLDPTDFADRRHREAFEAIRAVRAQGIPASPAVVYQEVGPDGGLSAEDLEDLSFEATAAKDLDALRIQLRTIRLLHTKRTMVARLRELALCDPSDASSEERTRLETTLQEVGALFGQLASPGGAPAIRSADLVEIAETPIESPPWVFDGWLAEGDVAFFAGQSYVGKSWALLDLAFALARGQDYLGAIPFAAQSCQRVLYIDEENNPRLVRYRLKRYYAGNRITATELADLPLLYLYENGINFDDPLGWRRILQVVEEFRPDWILLDSMIRFHQRDENKSGEMSRFFVEKLKGLAARAGAGIVALHHLRKGEGTAWERMRGSSDLEAQVDQGWALERAENGTDLIFSHEKNRWGQTAPPLGIEIEDVGDGTVVRSTGRADDARGAILRALEEATIEGVPRQRLLELVKAEGIRDPGTSVKRHLGKLYHEDRVRKAQDGRGKRYWLTAFAPAHAE